MTTRFSPGMIVGCMLIGTLAGCSRGPARPMAEEVPVTGIVTLDGKPLAGASVTFTCTNPPAIFAGATDDSGRYHLSSNFGSSAKLEGPCTVTISKMELPPGVEPPPPDMPMSPELLGAKETLPPKYSNGQESTLTANVAPGGGEINFELTSQ